MRLAPLLCCITLSACTGEPKDADPQDTGGDTSGGSGSDSGSTPEPYGPDNAWYHAPDASKVPEEPATDQWEVGSQVPNLHFTDQNGDEVWLYQFQGQTIYLDWVAEWCGPCATYSPYLDAFYQEYSEDAVVLSVMVYDVTYQPGDADAVSRWVANNGSSNPVLWLDEEQYSRAFDPSYFPEINLIDPQLRLAQQSVTSLHGDAWIEQIVDRMTFAIGGSLDNDAETCDNGYDDDLDLIADCMDDACSDDPVCAETEFTGSVTPCVGTEDEAAQIVDVWQVEVRGAVASVEADNVSESTGFENLLMLKEDGQTWEDARTLGDDEWDCSWPLEEFGCARGWIRPGTWQVLVRTGTGGDDLNGDCVDPDLGEYVLRVKGDVSMTLIADNVPYGDL